MGKIQKCRWDDTKGVAENIFNIFMCREDLGWAESAWHILEKTPLCTYTNQQEYYRVVVRLFCLGEIFHIYNELARDETYEPFDEYPEWVDESGLEKIRLIVLAGEAFYEDSYVDYEEISEVLDCLMEEEYEMVIHWLWCGFGSKANLLRSLEIVCNNASEEDILFGEGLREGSGDMIVSHETSPLIEWMEAGFPRAFV